MIKQLNHNLNVYHGDNLLDHIEYLTNKHEIKHSYVNYPLNELTSLQHDFYWNHRFTALYVVNNGQQDCYWITELLDIHGVPIVLEHVFSNVNIITDFKVYKNDIQKVYEIILNESYDFNNMMTINSHFIALWLHLIFNEVWKSDTELDSYLQNYNKRYVPEKEYPIMSVVSDIVRDSDRTRADYRFSSFELGFIGCIIYFDNVHQVESLQAYA